MLALVESPYTRTTDAVYSVFHHSRAVIPGVRFGGAYTFKEGFHSSVEDNLEHWPRNYSVRDAINRRPPTGVGRALDLTMNEAQMRLRTGYLRAAALADDPRMGCVKEFYGTLNGTSVYGLTHLYPEADWTTSTADSSHTWHIHLSFFTPYCDNWTALAGVVSVLAGESLDDYLSGGTMERNIAEYGDSGTWVAFVQRLLQAFGGKLTRDGRWGDETTAAARWVFVNRFGGKMADYDGRRMTDWMLLEFLRRDGDLRRDAAIKAALANFTPPAAVAPTQAQVNAAVAWWMDANAPRVQVAIGTVPGTITSG